MVRRHRKTAAPAPRTTTSGDMYCSVLFVICFYAIYMFGNVKYMYMSYVLLHIYIYIYIYIYRTLRILTTSSSQHQAPWDELGY